MSKNTKQYYVTANIEFVCQVPYGSTKQQDLASIEKMIAKGKIPQDILVSDINIEEE